MERIQLEINPEGKMFQEKLREEIMDLCIDTYGIGMARDKLDERLERYFIIRKNSIEGVGHPGDVC